MSFQPLLARAPVSARLRTGLIAAANHAGWPYYRGKSSRIEPTCWALLALGDTWKDDAVAWQRFAAPHLQWLAATQREDGLLREDPAAPPNFTANGFAACVFAHLERAPERLLDGIVAVKGVAVDSSEPGLDSTLQGWPWMPDTFSWLEPTCWCLLALRKAGTATRGAQARIYDAEKVIANRTCQSGGWNYGNASVVGQDLRPYVPTTALGLIALQGRPMPAVERSLAWLKTARLNVPSAMALALTAMCLRIYGIAADDVEARLSGDSERAEWVGNLQAIAMMIYALTAATHDVKALRV